jgi:1,4-dihydroxy-2-naphthoate octaprenyltransferase
MKNKKGKRKSITSEKNYKAEKGGKSARNNAKKPGNKKRVKAIILLCIALFFFAYMFYAGSTIAGFFALIIGIVCGLIGILYFK